MKIVWNGRKRLESGENCLKWEEKSRKGEKGVKWLKKLKMREKVQKCAKRSEIGKMV